MSKKKDSEFKNWQTLHTSQIQELNFKRSLKKKKNKERNKINVIKFKKREMKKK